MKILYDLTATQPSVGAKFHGGGEYAKILFFALIENKSEEEVICIYDINRFIEPKIIDYCSNKGINLIKINSRYDIPLIIEEYKCDKFYTAMPYDYFDLKFKNTEFVYTIHGLRNLEMPTDRYEYKYNKSIKLSIKFILKFLLKKTYDKRTKKKFINLFNSSTKRKILVPSLHTKYSIISNFPQISPNEIEVFYSPRKNVESEDNIPILQRHDIEFKKYFLLISCDRWQKNSYRAIKAFDEIFSLYPSCDYKVLLVGAKNHNNIVNREKFKICGYVEEEELELLYKYAYAFIYPTLNEGFGYPPLEAMKYGTPVASSAITSITEICGDAVLYFSPFSIDEIKVRILELLFEYNKEVYQEKLLSRYEYISNRQDEMLKGLVDFILS